MRPREAMLTFSLRLTVTIKPLVLLFQRLDAAGVECNRDRAIALIGTTFETSNANSWDCCESLVRPKCDRSRLGHLRFPGRHSCFSKSMSCRLTLARSSSAFSIRS